MGDAMFLGFAIVMVPITITMAGVVFGGIVGSAMSNRPGEWSVTGSVIGLIVAWVGPVLGALAWALGWVP